MDQPRISTVRYGAGLVLTRVHVRVEGDFVEMIDLRKKGKDKLLRRDRKLFIGERALMAKPLADKQRWLDKRKSGSVVGATRD